ncbi:MULTISPECIES: ABC transporter permease [unclassified Pseudofrankia]|uniref:ABC transporter permease n=1 Tax=unclassified Pseudofrankia TaxID=2994372 RepID=UPI0008D9E823|nr:MULTISPECIES: ABC transporter permease [unclassified Pseudofrankia]MDT3438633.1 hypothetical protein [Pseudofrankia sp. BMG5.37]OHV49369.1 ABC transporter permease [Pseudofrankia sp. BMG5.36]
MSTVSTHDRGYGYAHAVRMEWIKLRTLRSTRWTLLAAIASAIGIATAVGASEHTDPVSDVTNSILSGVAPGLLLLGILGVLTMTSEYSSGMILATLAAVPNRLRLLAAKATVFGLAALAVGEAAAFLAFFAGSAALPQGQPAPALDQPAVLRAVVLSGAGLSLVSLLGLGLGAILRHSAVALAVFVVGALLVGQFALVFAPSAARYVPLGIVANSLAVATPKADALSPWAGLGLLCLYAAVALGAGGWLLTRRDS